MKRGRPPTQDILTPREWEVLDLLRQGLSNREIAERLGISYDGARFHVAQILSKLNVSSRQEAASWRAERRYWGLGFLAALVERSRLETAMKLTSLTLLAGVVASLVLLSVGLALATTRAPKADEQDTTALTVPPLDQPLERAPYRLVPAGYDAPLPSTQAPLDRAHAASAPAADLEAARASSLFPIGLPEGYQVVAADSAGRPAELYLELTLSGPTGEVVVIRSRPEAFPVDIRVDQNRADAQLRPFNLIALVPKDSTEPTVLRGYADEGIDISVSGIVSQPDDLLDLYLRLSRHTSPLAAESMFPRLPPESERLPRAESIEHTGPCRITPSVKVQYATQQVIGLELIAAFTCTGVVEAQPCPPEAYDASLGYQRACDADGLFIDTFFTVKSNNSGLQSSGRTAVLDDGSVASAVMRSFVANGASGHLEPIEICVHMRFTDTCARFTYEVP